MKKCKQCGHNCTNQAELCPSCSSRDFSWVCANCGAVFSGTNCPDCGIRGGTRRKECPNCGTVYFSSACPQCGYSSRKRTKAGVQGAPKVARKKPSIWIVLLWIFFLPIMGCIAVARAKRLSKGLKIGVISVIAVITLAFAFSPGTTQEAAPAQSTQRSAASVTPMSAPAATAKPLDTPAPEPTMAPAPSPSALLTPSLT